MTPPSRYSQWQSDVAWYIRGPLLVDCIFRIFSPCYQFVLCLLNVECSVQMSSHKLSFASILKIVALEEKVRKLKTDLKRAQDKNKYSEGEVSLEEKDVFLFFPSFLPCFIHLCVASSAFSLIVQHFFLSSSVCFFVLYLTIPTVICLLNWSSNSRNSLCPSLVDLLFQIQQYSRNIDELKSQLGLSQDKLHKRAQEATNRDEQLVVLKVELATLQEKHRLIQDEVNGQF